MNERHFDHLVRRHHRAVHAYARSMTGSHHLADDAAQETFLRAWRYLDSFRGDGNFEGWLIRICRRCVFDLQAGPIADPLTGDMRTGAGDEGLSVDLLLTLQGLSTAHREVLVLCGLLGYDYESAAAVLDLPVGTVRSRLHRARTCLSEQLTGHANHTA